MLVEWAGVAQLAERLLPKQDVVGSSPIARSYPAQCAPEGNGCTRHVPSGSSFLVPCCPYGHELLNNRDAISAISYDALDAATEPFQAAHPGQDPRSGSSPVSQSPGCLSAQAEMTAHPVLRADYRCA